MNDYLTYGLRIRSEIPLPELADRTDGLPPDVVIRRGVLDISDDERARVNVIDFAPDGTVRYFWSEVVGARVSADGRDVLIEAAHDASDDLLAFPILGPILSEILRAHGHFVLHAGAVVIDGQAVGFMADKGGGKSTTTTMLVSSGARLLTDDLFAIHAHTGLAPPGFGQVKLVAEARAFVPEGATVRPEVHDKIDKTRVKLGRFDAKGHFPVPWVFVLERGTGEDCRIEPLCAEEALVALVRFSFPERFGDAGAAHGRGTTDFLNAVSVSRQVRVARLIVPDSIEALSRLSDRISSFLSEERDV